MELQENHVYFSTCEKETFNLGIEFAAQLEPGDTVAFYGDLGAGKTEFIKGICSAFNVEEIVSSPTYTIINQYAGADSHHRELTIYHVDLYRIEDNTELAEIGLEEALNDPEAIKLVEWAENGNPALPKHRYDIRLQTETNENCRRIVIERHGTVAVGLNGSSASPSFRFRW